MAAVAVAYGHVDAPTQSDPTADPSSTVADSRHGQATGDKLQQQQGQPQQHQSTAFHGTEGTYMLPHHEREIARLQTQHRFMNTTTDGRLLFVPVQGKEHLRVLDVGCADGTWLTDLPRTLPNTRLSLHGIDIGSNLFPRSGRVPLDLRRQNAIEPFPADWNWSGSFDVVHQRLLVWGIKSHEWAVVIRNLRDVLKPGGWLQLVEGEWIHPERHRDSAILQKQALLQGWSTSTFGMDVDIAWKLEGLVRGAGLVDVGTVYLEHGYGARAKDPKQADISAELWVECFRTLDQKIGVDGIPGVAKDAAEFHRFLDELKAEIKKVGYQPRLKIVYGRKPLVDEAI